MSVCHTASPAPRLPIGHAVLDHVGDDIELGMAFDEAPAGLLNRCQVELAQPAAERDELAVGELLSRKEQRLVREPGAGEWRQTYPSSSKRRSRPRTSAPSAAPLGTTVIPVIGAREIQDSRASSAAFLHEVLASASLDPRRGLARAARSWRLVTQSRSAQPRTPRRRCDSTVSRWRRGSAAVASHAGRAVVGLRFAALGCDQCQVRRLRRSRVAGAAPRSKSRQTSRRYRRRPAADRAQSRTSARCRRSR